MIRKVTGMLSVLTVIAYSEPLSVLSRKGTQLLSVYHSVPAHREIDKNMRQRTEARHLLYFTIMILHLSPTAPHKTGPSSL